MPIRYPCALFLLVLPGFGVAADKVAATVNGESIAAAEVDAAVAQIPAAEIPLSAAQKRVQRYDVLQQLIDDRLVRQYLRQNGPKVDAAEVDRQFAALESGLKSRGTTVESYLKEAGVTVAQAKENFLRMLQLAKFTEAQATDATLRSYFEANRDFFDKTMVRCSQIVLRIPEITPPAERQKSLAKLQSIRADLAAKRTDFATAAKAYSQCPSAAKGGDVGFIARKFQADEPFAQAAFALPVGGVSDVVETDIGYHLIWVTERKPGKPMKYEEAAAEVRECFEAELKQNLLAELRKKAKIEVRKSD